MSVDFHVPVLWEVYPGNQHDGVIFAQVLQELTKRYQTLARDCPSNSLIFDKGNNGTRNQEILDGSDFPFVGSFLPTHYADLLALPLKSDKPLQDACLHPTRALRLTRPVWGAGTHPGDDYSPELQHKQIRGIQHHLSKKRRASE